MVETQIEPTIAGAVSQNVPCKYGDEFLVATQSMFENLVIDFTEDGGGGETDEGVCISKIIVNYFWGKCDYVEYDKAYNPVINTIYYSKPGITVRYKSIKDEDLLLYSIDPEDPLDQPPGELVLSGMEAGQAILTFDVQPKYMIEDRISRFYINLEAELNQGLMVKSIELFKLLKPTGLSSWLIG